MMRAGFVADFTFGFTTGNRCVFFQGIEVVSPARVFACALRGIVVRFCIMYIIYNSVFIFHLFMDKFS